MSNPADFNPAPLIAAKKRQITAVLTKAVIKVSCAVESFEILPGVYAVRRTDKFQTTEQTGMFAPMRAWDAIPRFCLTNSAGLAVVLGGGDPAEVNQDFQRRIPFSFVTIQTSDNKENLVPEENAWDDLLAGRAKVYEQLRLDFPILLDPETGRSKPLDFTHSVSCRHLYKMLVSASPETRYDVAVALVSLPGIVIQFDDKDAVSNLVGWLEDPGQHTSVTMKWLPDAATWNLVMERVLETLTSDERTVTALNGQRYPLYLDRALQRALLELHPEVSALLERASTPTPGMRG